MITKLITTLTNNRITTKTFLIGTVLTAILGAAILVGCTTNGESREGPANRGETTGQEISERGGGESGGEHGAAGEGAEGSETGGEGGSEEATANQLAPDETFDTVRNGARLVMNYDAPSNSFKGTVENTTSQVLSRVRIEVHLSNGTELGPTTPIDMAPGQILPITLDSTQAPFTSWIPHAEVGGGEGGQAAEGAGGENGPDGPEGPESGNEGGSTEIGEAAMSSPITPLDQTWDGVLGPLAVSARYDAATQTVHSTVRNISSQTVCYVQAEPHLKSGTQTVGELGPDKLGDLAPGQEATTSISVASEPNLAGVAFDGYVVHMEVFDCAGPGPVPHTGGEGTGEHGGAGGEGHGPGGEGGNEGGGEGPESGGEEGSGAMLAPDETFDVVRSGARLVLGYDAQSNSFKGTVENTTNQVLTRVRIEVHLSNGAELGPTTPINLAPGQTVPVILQSTQAPFTGWIAHAEVGGGEGGGGEHGASGEHGGGGEGGGEHGGRGESGGEHGSRGERQGGG